MGLLLLQSALAASPMSPATAERVNFQVWLSRTPYQPGVIDGAAGPNFRHALASFQSAAGLPATGSPDPETEAALGAAADADQRPALVTYTVTDADVAGPFLQYPKGLYAEHELACTCYRSPWELLAEKFQASPRLLSRLNPGVDLDVVLPGDTLVVPDPGAPLDTKVARITVDVVVRTLSAYDADGTLLRQYPTVVGPDFAAYRGELRVTGVKHDPDYHLDPKMWEEIPDKWPAVTIPPGPNSPVGVVWMQLSREGYGIHGTSSPELVGHTESHGCVRLTNWSAKELANEVTPGKTLVNFVGVEQG